MFTAATGGLTDNFIVKNVNIYHSSVASLSSGRLNGNATLVGGQAWP